MPEQLQQAGPAMRERIQQSFARQGLMSLLGEDGERKLVTHGQQTLIRVDRSAE